MDKRYSGTASGISSAPILGRVHSAELNIGKATYSSSFTVMGTEEVDLILGLDMLKHLQAVIDLKHNKLVFCDGNEVDFLDECDIPDKKDPQSNSMVSGPRQTSPLASSSTTAGPSNHPEPATEQLMSLGFARDQAIAALDSSNGTVERAARLLALG